MIALETSFYERSSGSTMLPVILSTNATKSSTPAMN
ncbi:hypothetical protein ID866_6531 [Astraeus odoratus]|nr:hypothetical protein ID866_6531 [Astraeus odoratus]